MALELATGIAGLISLADVVVVKGSKFYSLAKNAIPEIQGLLKEVINLGGALYSLEKSIILFNSICEEQGYQRLDSLVYIEDCKKCILDLQVILDKCSPEDFSRWQRVKSSLRWPISASETRELATKVQRLKSTIAVGLEADSLEALCRILSGQKSVQESLHRIEREQIRVARLDKLKQEDAIKETSLKWFSTYKSRKHTDLKRVRHPGTSVWFRDCQEYQSWLQCPNSPLWFDGIPGAGKSVLTSAIIEDLQLLENSSTRLAYYYIEYKSEKSHSFHTMTGCLMRQLIERNTDALRIASTLVDDNEFQDLHFEDIIEVFSMVSKCYTTTMLVIDGLDECESIEDRRDILQFISTLGHIPHGTIKIIATSRSIFDIRNSFSGFANISIAARSTDIKLFVAAELEKRLRSEVEFYSIRLQDPCLKTEIISSLVKGTNGMFQWVRCQLDTLSRLSGDISKRAALQNLPIDLPETYRRVMRRIEKANRQLVISTILWIDIESRILPLGSLTDIVSHHIGEKSITERDILSSCSSLIKIRSDTTVQFSHLSVWEFLTSEAEAGEWYHISSAISQKFSTDSSNTVFQYMGSCRWENENSKDSSDPAVTFLNGKHPFRKYVIGFDRKRSFYKPELLPAAGCLKVDNPSYLDMVQSNSALWQNFAHNILYLLSAWLWNMFVPPIHPSFLSSDVENSRLHIACFLFPHDKNLIKWLKEERGYDVETRILGHITPIHAWLSSPAMFTGLMNWDTLSDTLDMLLTLGNIDYQTVGVISSSGLLGGIEDFDSIKVLVIQKFQSWVSYISADEAYRQICHELARRLNLDPNSDRLREFGMDEEQSVEYDFDIYKARFSGVINSGRLPIYWEVLISSRDFFPHFGICLRKWIDIFLQGGENTKYTAELIGADSSKELDQGSICLALVEQKKFACLNCFLKIGMDLALPEETKLRLLDKLIASKSPPYKTELQIQDSFPYLCGSGAREDISFVRSYLRLTTNLCEKGNNRFKYSHFLLKIWSDFTRGFLNSNPVFAEDNEFGTLNYIGELRSNLVEEGNDLTLENFLSSVELLELDIEAHNIGRECFEEITKWVDRSPITNC